MKYIAVCFLFLLISSCSKKIRSLPYKIGTCVKERSRFVASFSPEAFETYKLKTRHHDGYYMYRYNVKGKRLFYRHITDDEVRDKDWTKVECPDKKEIILFTKPK